MKHRDEDDRPPLHAEYTNYFQIGHDAFEFLFDFGQLCDRDRSIHIHSRVMMPPDVAQHFIEVMAKTLATYERRFGRLSISAPEQTTEYGDTAPGRVTN